MLTGFDKAIKLFVFIIIGIFVLNFFTGGALVSAYKTAISTNDSRSYSLSNPPVSSPRFTIKFADIPKLPPLLQFAALTTVVGGLILGVSHFAIVIQAMIFSVGWGLVCLIIPFSPPVYGIFNFERCKYPLLGYLVGIIMMAIGWCVFAIH